jgi:hypothetical protein
MTTMDRQKKAARTTRAPYFTTNQLAFTVLLCFPVVLLPLAIFSTPVLVVLTLILLSAACAVPVVRCARTHLTVDADGITFSDIWRTVSLDRADIAHFEVVSAMPLPPVVIVPFTAIAVVNTAGSGWPIYATCLHSVQRRDELVVELGTWARSRGIPFRVRDGDLTSWKRGATRRYGPSWKSRSRELGRHWGTVA